MEGVTRTRTVMSHLRFGLGGMILPFNGYRRYTGVLGSSNRMVRNAYGSGSDLSLKSSRTIRGPVLRQIRDLTGFSVAVLIWFGIWSVPVYVLLLCSLVFETNTGANSLSKAIAQENYARGLSKHLSELCVGIENTHECF